jgi:D-sedoheptulose 7-phosphate isomerase
VNRIFGVAIMTFYNDYCADLIGQIQGRDWSELDSFADDLFALWKNRKRLFICGNGGSGGNAIHLANDFMYGVNPTGRAIDAEALTANSAVLTCLGNDIGFDNIFSQQLNVKGQTGDLLLVMSGSGNSANIVNALNVAKQNGIKSYAFLGYQGGKAKSLADVAIHFAIDDMQIAEDLQLVMGHMLMRKLSQLINGKS